MRTKAEILENQIIDLRAKAEEIEMQLESLRKTPCGLTCSGCRTYLETEYDFAAHFLIKDERYLNLGDCPEKIGESKW